MNYTPAEIILMVSSITASVTGMTVAIITAWRTGTRVETANSKIAVIDAKITEVHTATNSNYQQQQILNAKQTEELIALRKELQQAQLTLQRDETTRRNLATETAKRE